MELSLYEITPALVGVVAVLATYGIWKKQHKQHYYPDGPFSFPVLGNLPQVVLVGSMGKFIAQYRKVFGNIFTIEFGGTKRVVVSGYQNIHDMLVKNADITSNRTIQSLPQSLIDIIDDAPGLFWARFPHWKTIRSFSLSVMREEGMGKQVMEPKILDEIDRFCEYYIEPRCGQSVELSRALSKATCNVISEMIFGGRYDYDDSLLDEFIDSMDKNIQSSLRAGITKNIPFAKYFKSSGLKDNDDSLEVLVPEMRKRIERHRSDLDPDNPKDIFDSYLIHQSTVGTTESAFTDGNAMSMSLQLYGAGTETTSTALRWALLYACLHSEVKERVQQEIHNEIGYEKPVTYRDRSSLPYTEAVLLETLRLANIVPNALPHALDKSLEVDGVVIPAGAELMLDVASVLYDEEVFEDPLTFKPERYLTGDVTLKKQRTIPFGLGRRVCLGENLARMEFFMFYVTLLQRYDFKLSPSSKHVSTVPISGFINHPEAYELEFHRWS